MPACPVVRKNTMRAIVPSSEIVHSDQAISGAARFTVLARAGTRSRAPQSLWRAPHPRGHRVASTSSSSRKRCGSSPCSRPRRLRSGAVDTVAVARLGIVTGDLPDTECVPGRVRSPPGGLAQCALRRGPPSTVMQRGLVMVRTEVSARICAHRRGGTATQSEGATLRAGGA